MAFSSRRASSRTNVGGATGPGQTATGPPRVAGGRCSWNRADLHREERPDVDLLQGRDAHGTFADPEIDWSRVVDTTAPDGANLGLTHRLAGVRKGNDVVARTGAPRVRTAGGRVAGETVSRQDSPPYYSGGRIEFEGVRLEGAGTQQGSVVITFRAPDRPGCLYLRPPGRRGRAAPLQDPGGAPELWAQMVWIHLEEDVQTGAGLTKRCDPGTVTWVCSAGDPIHWRHPFVPRQS